MKGPADDAPYELSLSEHQAAITPAGTFLQLSNNDKAAVCKVLYIVSPAFLFEMRDGVVSYDDAVVIAYDWEELERRGWQLDQSLPTPADRAAATPEPRHTRTGPTSTGTARGCK